MPLLEDLDLPTLPLAREDFAADPIPWLNQARAQHPWIAKCDFGYVVHEHQAIEDLLRQDDRMYPSFDTVIDVMGAKDTPWGRFTAVQLLAQTGDNHKRMRDLLQGMFTPAAAHRNRPLMRATMQQLLDDWAPQGQFDFEEFISYYPISVLSAMIGASPQAIPQLRSSLETMGLGFAMDPSFLPSLQDAVNTLDEFVQQLVAERRADTQSTNDDLLADLLNAGSHGTFSEREIYDLLIFMFVAGYDTSKNVMTLIMHRLLDHPEDYRRCAEDIDYARKVVQEVLRLRNPTMVFRKVATPFDYRGVTLPEGAFLFFAANLSGRDPRAFSNPDGFDPERVTDDKTRHIAFGRGMHICLGQHIARAQIEEGLQLIAQRLQRPKLVGDVNYRPFYGVGGLRGLPIAFELGIEQ